MIRFLKRPCLHISIHCIVVVYLLLVEQILLVFTKILLCKTYTVGVFYFLKQKESVRFFTYHDLSRHNMSRFKIILERRCFVTVIKVFFGDVLGMKKELFYFLETVHNYTQPILPEILTCICSVVLVLKVIHMMTRASRQTWNETG